MNSFVFKPSALSAGVFALLAAICAMRDIPHAMAVETDTTAVPWNEKETVAETFGRKTAEQSVEILSRNNGSDGRGSLHRQALTVAGQSNKDFGGTSNTIRTAPALATIDALAAAAPNTTELGLVDHGRASAIIVCPDTSRGRAAAETIAETVLDRTGVPLEIAPGTKAQALVERPAILLGNIDNNPALVLLYARYLTPADSVCPGPGGALVHTVCNPFGRGGNVIVAAASSDEGLARAAEMVARAIRQQPKGRSLILPRLFDRQYGPSFLKRFSWAGEDAAPDRLEEGIREGRQALERGKHTSVAGVLASVAERYRLTGQSVEAKLFVKLWDLYAKSAKSDPRKFGGPWGFDSDFPSSQVVSGWDVIEHDPALTDAERLRTTKNMGRWLKEAVIPKCAGAARSERVLFNHQTFPGLGALYAGLYFSQQYHTVEGRQWLQIADAMFRRQMTCFKPHEDCNGYQWLTNGHVMQYSLARPDRALFENGNGAKIIDYCIGTMDNLGYQVPYGDTGPWDCWNSEMICLDMFAFATGSAEARWAANRKREIKQTVGTHAYYQQALGKCPSRFNGVKVWPLEPRYYSTHTAAARPPLSRCFDKISFREAMEPRSAYLLLDGLSNGGHKHLDGNSLPRLTWFNRIWLADNDYYKSAVKFHNSVTVLRDGQAAPIPPYVELSGAGETENIGYSTTRVADYAGADWSRTIVWLKKQQAFVVLDKLTALAEDEYQFRALWHGVGTATCDDHGMLLTQKGPSLRIDVGPGPDLRLEPDPDLGANWKGYPHADPVVRSLQAIATVRLKRGESHLFASVLHGREKGTAGPWKIAFLKEAEGIRLTTPQGTIGVVLRAGRSGHLPPEVATDAKCVVAFDRTAALLGATFAEIAGQSVFHAKESRCIERQIPALSDWIAAAPVRSPVVHAGRAFHAPAHRFAWCRQPLADRSPNRSPARKADFFVRLTNASLRSANRPDTILGITRAGKVVALSPDGSVQWTVDTGTQLNDLAAADLTGDGKDEIILARQDYKVQVLDNHGKPIWTRELTYYRRPPHVNLVRTGDIDGDGVPEVIAGGENWRFYAYRADGTELWNYESVHPSRSGAVVDLDGDGKAEVICGTHYYWATALNSDGTARWKYRFGPICHDIATGRFKPDRTRGAAFGGGDGNVHVVDSHGKRLFTYATGDDVEHVVVGDLDGDGIDEILAGSLNNNLYCFDATGKRRWRLDLDSPISALATAANATRTTVVAGTTRGRLVTIGGNGTVQAISELGSPVRAILVRDGQSVIATADGRLRKE